MRWQPRTLKAIDRWRRDQGGHLARAEAIRRLVEMALAAAAPAKLTSRQGAAKATELAATTIDNLIDEVASAAPSEEQKKRKRRLLKGPSEFREIRADLPKPK